MIEKTIQTPNGDSFKYKINVGVERNFALQLYGKSLFKGLIGYLQGINQILFLGFVLEMLF